MTPSAADRADISGKIPLLVATASILQISESMLPHPVPGLRFGLANIVSLIILVQYGFKPALTVTLLRIVVSSFIIGTFLSPGFMLSFAGGLASISVAGILSRISDRFPVFRISPVGLSIAGAFIHNMVQLYLAYLMLIKHPGIFFLIPWLAFGSVILGAVSGFIASGVIKQLTANGEAVSVSVQSKPAYKNRTYQPGTSWLHTCRPEIKFTAILGVTLMIVLIESLVLYGALFIIILILVPTTGLRYKTTFHVIKRISLIVLSSFLLPVYFNSGTRILVETAYYTLHQEAFITGCVFATRIVILALISSILAQTTRPDAITAGIRTFIRPFDRVGMNSSTIAQILSDSLRDLPKVWHEIRSAMAALLKGRKRNIKTLKLVVTELFVYVFSTKNGRPR
ncbi:MAG: hypothetical protein HKM93_05570 [Desulfobacteraceae bacterium]|nr:hypothetical protein [Desulfobacteraceae bacterium]